jgi:hypothetical protein
VKKLDKPIMKPTPEIHRRDRSPEELRAIKAIGRLDLRVGERGDAIMWLRLSESKQLSEVQRKNLWDCVWRLRRQISDKELVAIAGAWHEVEQGCK